MTAAAPPWSQPVRLNEIGAGIDRRLEADAETRTRVARALDLAELAALTADLTIAPAAGGWRATGRVVAEAVQTCGLTLEPLPVSIDAPVSVRFVETDERPEETEVEVSLDDDAPDVIEGGAIDLGAVAVEQLALNLDPFPRKPGAVFTAPEGPPETSPFAVLNRLKARDSDDAG